MSSISLTTSTSATGEELTATLRVNVHWEEPRLFLAVTVYSPESVAKAAGISNLNVFPS